eukprot:1129765-Prymnesium_polylepis.2
MKTRRRGAARAPAGRSARTRRRGRAAHPQRARATASRSRGRHGARPTAPAPPISAARPPRSTGSTSPS